MVTNISETVQALQDLQAEFNLRVLAIIEGLWEKREYPSAEDVEIPPGEKRTLRFGVDYPIPNSSVFDIPETEQHGFGFQHGFMFDSLVLPDEIAGKLTVVAILVGAGTLWASAEVPGTRFAASVEKPIVFKKHARPSNNISVLLYNPTAEPVVARGKVVGSEQPGATR